MKPLRNIPPREPKKPLSEKAKGDMRRVLLLSLVFMFVYFGAQSIPVPEIVYVIHGAYMLALGVFAIVYICYNYAFTRKGVTMDMLPDQWSDQQKHDFIAKGEEHKAKSRWMIFVIFPLIATFIADALYLFVWTGFLEKLFV